MRRRDFLAALSGLMVSPLSAGEPGRSLPVIGLLHAGSPEEVQKRLAAFVKGLAAGGFFRGGTLQLTIGGHSAETKSFPNSLRT
jgi:hypothetical protein